MMEDGTVIVENCSCCWHTTEDDLAVDVMACHILFYIFRRYQEEGEIPEEALRARPCVQLRACNPTGGNPVK